MGKKNINLNSDRYCTGCGVCETVCPVKAITVTLNENGFIEASANNDTCIDCRKCVKVCAKYLSAEASYLNSITGSDAVYMSASRDESIKIGSSSGGLGYELSKKSLEMGYEVCGVVYTPESDRAEHCIVSDINGLLPFMGSKYLQSYTSGAFLEFHPEKKYLVFGTPCQIYALRQKIKLENREQNFILIDFFCHGVPSYRLWENYIGHIKKKNGIDEVKEVYFRDKTYGWHDYSMKIIGDEGSYIGKMRKDLFYLFYLSNTCLNKACYDCSFRLDNVYSDIRLGDFWGRKYGTDQKGVSLVTINTDVGRELFKSLEDTIVFEYACVDDLLSAQPTRNIPVPANRDTILSLLKVKNNFTAIYKKFFMKNHLKNRFAYFMKGLVPPNMRTMARSLKAMPQDKNMNAGQS